MKITRTSPFSGVTRTKEINISITELSAWECGLPIQDAAPHLTASDREFIMTGITDNEWDEVFAEQDDGYDEYV